MSASTKHFRMAEALGEERIGFEARAQVNDHVDIKIWLRLLACSTQIEKIVRHRLRARFGTTLPRFDYLSQLDRYPEGLRMNVLSRYLMVTGGNVTAVTDQLVKEGLVTRTEDPEDRRSYKVSLTEKGKHDFTVMAREHELWLGELMGGLPKQYKDDLYGQLGQLRVHLAQSQSAAELQIEETGRQQGGKQDLKRALPQDRRVQNIPIKDTPPKDTPIHSTPISIRPHQKEPRGSRRKNK